jgi:hypothetical protein
LEHREVETHLAICSECRDKVAAAVEMFLALAQMQRDIAEMRAARRVPTNDPATIEVVNPVSLDQWEIRIRDVSERGMGLRTPRPLDRGTEVIVRRDAVVVYGEVRYCVRVGKFYQVGIRVQENKLLE